MRFVVVGAGGVGGLLSGLLAAAGHDVGVVARGEHGRAIQERGLRLRGPEGESIAASVRVAEDPQALGPADAVLVAVKAWQVTEVAPRIAPLLGERTLVVPLQNGVEAAPRLAAALGKERVCLGLCHMLSFIEAPGSIQWKGELPSVTLSARTGAQQSLVEAVCQALAGARVRATVRDDIDAALWEKLLFVSPFGAVGAASRSPVGVVRRGPETRRLLTRAMEEIHAVARARGVRVADDAVARALSRIDALPPDATSSLHRDILAGRPSELHDLTGAVVRLGREASVPVLANEFLLAVLAPQEEAARAAPRE